MPGERDRRAAPAAAEATAAPAPAGAHGERSEGGGAERALREREARRSNMKEAEKSPSGGESGTVGATHGDPAADDGGAGIAGIVLAAGTSSRMGSNKLLFELEGESLLRRAVGRALGGGLEPVLVVLGHEAERVAGELRGLACQAVVNPRYEEGITSSLHAGLAALPASPRAAVVLLADMPLVTAEMIAGLVARYRATRAPLVISDYEGVNAPPMLYDRALFGELLAMQGGGCGRKVVERHRQRAEVLTWPARALSDLDVPDDYVRMKGAAAAEAAG